MRRQGFLLILKVCGIHALLELWATVETEKDGQAEARQSRANECQMETMCLQRRRNCETEDVICDQQSITGVAQSYEQVTLRCHCMDGAFSATSSAQPISNGQREESRRSAPRPYGFSLESRGL